MMNNKGALPSNPENKMKPEIFPTIKKQQLPQQISSMATMPSLNNPSSFPNREMFPQMENMNSMNNNENDISKIKEKTKIDRNQKIEKYKNKKRNWKKKISYDCRKKVADARLRIKGRFISKKVPIFSSYLKPFIRILKKFISLLEEGKKKPLTTKTT